MSKRLDDLMAEAERVQQQRWNAFWATVVDASSILNEIDPVERRPWLASVIRDLYRQQDGNCGMCGEPIHMVPGEWEVDHKIPFCYGGGNEPTNLQIAHWKCNRDKGHAVDPMDLLRYLEGRYSNLRRPERLG